MGGIARNSLPLMISIPIAGAQKKRAEKEPPGYLDKPSRNGALFAWQDVRLAACAIPPESHMSLSMHRACIPVFVRGLKVLDGLLDKAQAHEAKAGLAPGALIDARLAPDMQTLGNQVQRASDTCKFSAERLTGLKSPRQPDTETSYAELKARIAATVEFLNTVTPADLAGSEERGIPLKLGQTGTTLNGADYLLQFALPNFFFHVTTAHDILRNNGVKIGKLDYLGVYSS